MQLHKKQLTELNDKKAEHRFFNGIPPLHLFTKDLKLGFQNQYFFRFLGLSSLKTEL